MGCTLDHSPVAFGTSRRSAAASSSQVFKDANERCLFTVLVKITSKKKKKKKEKLLDNFRGFLQQQKNATKQKVFRQTKQKLK